MSINAQKWKVSSLHEAKLPEREGFENESIPYYRSLCHTCQYLGRKNHALKGLTSPKVFWQAG
jgi:hypothetical protein